MLKLAHGLAAAFLAATSVAASGQPVTQPVVPARTGPEIVLLGTAGGPPPHAARSQPASMLRVGNRTYLIDAGENAGQQLMRAGVRPRDIDVTFITHLHWDHVLGLGYLMATGWMMNRDRPMPIYGPPGTADFLRRQTSAVGFGETIFRSQAEQRPALASLFPAREIDVGAPREIYRDDRVRVTAVLNSHFAVVHGPRQSYGEDKSYAYRFDTPNGSIVFTGDTGPSEAVTTLARGADVLVSEIVDVDSISAGLRAASGGADISRLVAHMREQHLDAEAVGRMATAAGVRRLVLTHYVVGQRFDPNAFVAQIRPYFSGEIIVGQDLMRIPVTPAAAASAH